MVELYAIDNSGAALPLGPLLGVSGSRKLTRSDFAQCTFGQFRRAATPAPASSTDILINPLPKDIHTLLHTRASSGEPVKLALGWSDGSAAPTVTAGAFVFPGSRSFIGMNALVHELAERLTEDGKATEVRLRFNIDASTWFEDGTLAPAGSLSFTQSTKV